MELAKMRAINAQAEDGNVYTEHGYRNRLHYLRCVSEDYGIDLHTVITLAQLLGPSEDFDGLVVALEDAEPMNPDQIKHLRARKGMTQASMARYLGVGVRTIKHWESGTRIPTGSAMMALYRLSVASGEQR